MSQRLVLGTVQLGMDYGIKNIQGQPTQAEATEIVNAAYVNGIREFDTAQAYGQSEDVLGQAFVQLGIKDKVHVITKLDPNVDHMSIPSIEDAVHGSLNRLHVKHLNVLMLHREEFLNDFDAHSFESVLNSGHVLGLGTSVYTPEKALQALETKGILSVQIPSSIVDRRFENAGVLKKAKERNVTIYIRSVFLQGLLLMQPEMLPASMNFSKGLISQLDDLAMCHDISVQSLCLGYARAKWPSCKIIVGAQSTSELEENMKILPLSASVLDAADKAFEDIDEKILNPMLWPKWR